MDWKQKLKWKMLIILLAVIGIVIVWQANKSGSEKTGKLPDAEPAGKYDKRK